jgi:hypothetical protein
MVQRKALTSGSHVIMLLLTWLCINFPLMAQNNDDEYDTDWIKVEAFMKKSLPKSALTVIEEIYARAKKENNQPQLVKSVLYKMEALNQIVEEGDEQSIILVQEELKSAPFPASAIFHSILAEQYFRYYSNHRYQWLSRTTTQNPESEDIKTWDLKKLLDQVIYHHLQAVKESEDLKKMKREQYQVLLQEEIFNNDEERQDAIRARPTLFDFLSHRAIDRFMHAETSLTRPSDQFLLDDPLYLSMLQDFTAIKLNTADTMSLKFYALKLFQDLLLFHQKDEDPTALIDVDIKRLEFVYNQGIMDDKAVLYQQVLEKLQSRYASYPASADVAYKRAQHYASLANQYWSLESDAHKNDRTKAVSVCEEINTKYPKTNGAKNCRLLSKQLQEVSLSLMMDDVVIPDKQPLGLLSYTNVQQVYFRIILIDPSREKEIRQSGDSKKMLREYLSMKVMKQGSLVLPVDPDYNKHQVQVPLPALPAGYYIILLSPDENFDIEKDPVAYTSFWSSNLSYISKKNNKGEYEVFVLDRHSGNKLRNVTVECWADDYDYKSRKRVEKLWRSYNTDDEGYVKFNLGGEKNQRSFYLLLKSNRDKLASDEYFYLTNYIEKTDNRKEATFIFTDRAIYRPGQTIYYKGIMLEGKDNDLQVRPNYKTYVALYDVNGRLIAEQNLLTNEFGSFSGTFTAPAGILTGSMRISNEYGNREIRVEEYKRPRFEAKFLPLEGEYSLNSKVSLKGKANTYSGNPVDGARVSYRVVRTVRYPYWYGPHRIIRSQSSLEIVNGTTTCDVNGEFQVTFTTLPDKSVEKKLHPVFRYEITADVTDINGEVQSAKTYLSAAYTSYILSSDLPSEVNTDLLKQFQVSATNLSGKKVNTTATVTITQLQQPDNLYRNRKWARPDKFIMKEEEFHKLFPWDLYDNEDDKATWKVLKTMLNKKVQLSGDSVVEIPEIKLWPAGDYKIDMYSQDTSGDTIRYTKFFTLFSPDKKKIPGNIMKWASLSDAPVEPGEVAVVYFGSRSKEVSVLYELLKGSEVISRKWLEVNDEMIKLSVPVQEDYRGNIGLSFTFIKGNRYYQEIKSLQVPFTNKELEIQFGTFRDKLLPGQQEEWQLKITGKKKEKVASELLLGMYDAALDAFVPNQWNMDLYHRDDYRPSWKCTDVFSLKYSSQSYFHNTKSKESYYFRKYDKMIKDNTWNEYAVLELSDVKYSKGGVRGSVALDQSMAGESIAHAMRAESDDVKSTPVNKEEDMASAEPEQQSLLPQNPARANLRETAFFYPDLRTNEQGDIIVTFTLPESLTRWKVLGLAHTKDMKTGTITKEVTAQKDLMVFPNPPRFFREGDIISFSSKISSLSKEPLTGQVILQLFDAITLKEIGTEMLKDPVHDIVLPAGSSVSSSWTLKVPDTYQAILWRVTARAGDFSDGEESTLPVLSNRTLVTESLPLPVKGKGKFSFTMAKLAEQEIKKSSTLKNNQLSLEFSPNPAWYAVQALPYLMEFPYECSEQLFNRYYANQVATHIASYDLAIRKVFESWSKFTPSALLSNLEKNNDLKSLALEETPWVMQAKNESERKQRVGLLFDLNRMANEATAATKKLQQMQSPNGGWPWFTGMPDDRYITQYILSGYGHLQKLDIFKDGNDEEFFSMIHKAIVYTDQRINEEYHNLLRYNSKNMSDNHLNPSNIQYLYLRSFYLTSIDIDTESEEAVRYFKSQAAEYWTTQNPYLQGMIALALSRMGDRTTPKEILMSLKERAIHHAELGMYWKEVNSGYYWHQQGIATQALLIEAFDEINADSVSVEEMKVWLLKQKQTTDWKTTTATADACYALLLRGADLLKNTGDIAITVGSTTLKPQEDPEIKAEAGTGYFRKSWWDKDIQPSFARVTIDKPGGGIAWGALYWQYFEDLDKITAASGPVKIERQLYVKKNSKSGPVLINIRDAGSITVGDKVVVRITLISDRNLEYVHLKDHRAAGLEPVDVLSGYEYQDGLGYYQSTRDAAAHFFFSYLPKGTRIFEYTLNAVQKGEFSQGISSVECMYAPEFTSHSEGIKITIE